MSDAIREGSNGGYNTSGNTFPVNLLTLPTVFNFVPSAFIGINESNHYNLYSDGSWSNITNPNYFFNSAGSTLQSMFDQIGSSLWHDSVEKVWDSTLDNFGAVGKAIKDATEVGKIVANYESELTHILTDALSGFDPFVSPNASNGRNLFDKLNDSTNRFHDEARDYFNNKSSSLAEQLTNTLSGIISKQSFAIDPSPVSSTLYIYTYASNIKTINEFVDFTSYLLGEGKNLSVGPIINRYITAFGNYHDQSVTFPSKLSEYGFVNNYSLGQSGHEIVDLVYGDTFYLFGIPKMVFSDGTILQGSYNPLIDPIYYATSNKDVFSAGIDVNNHFNSYGWHEGRDPNLYYSTNGYLAANLDVRAAGNNPLMHYDQYGWKEGRDPSANFDDELYLSHNLDVKAAGIDPLAHYLANGQAEGRQAYAAVGRASDLGTHPGFDAEYYLLNNADVARAAISAGGDSFAFAYNHYESNGWHEGRNPNAIFNVNGYLNAYGDVKAANIDPLAHYEANGWREGRDPSASFDVKMYEATYKDVANAHIDPMLHYLQYGGVEGRTAFNDGHFG